MNEMVKSERKNEIVVYQPNETMRLEVRVENDTVWLTQAQLCELFGVVKSNVSRSTGACPSGFGEANIQLLVDRLLRGRHAYL